MKKKLFKVTWMGMILFLGFSLSVFAQQRTITGQVTDSGEGSPIPGVNVVVKGASTGAITDFDGNFSIQASNADILIFSYMGYTRQEVTVGANNNLKISLVASELGLDEVVVIGYGQVRKDDATGSLLSVSTKDFNKGATSPEELLSGKVSGVQITNSGGAPGSGNTIRIRGGASLSANNDPLIVIDGVPVDNDGVSGMANPLSSINPNDIESFTVLKDASATAIYGSRASNGVIIITTKKGSKEGMKINYNGNASIGFKTKEIEVFSADDFRALIISKYGTGSAAADLLGNSKTNWQDEIFQPAFGTDHLISISDAIYKIPTRVSLGYSNEAGILKTSSLKRFTGSVNINPSFFDDHLKVDLSLKGMNIKNRFAPTGAIGSAILFDPTQSVYDASSAYGGYFTWLDGGVPSTFATDNPVALLNQTKDESTVNRLIGNLKLTYNFHFLPELSATLNTGLDYSNSDGTVYIPADAGFQYSVASDGTDQSGKDKVYSQDKKNQLIDFYLNYSKELKSIKSKVDVMGGYSWQHFWKSDYVYSTSISKEYLIDPEVTTPTENYLVSFFGRLNYSLMDKYMLTFTVRDDGTSRFSKENRWGLFPSAALAWRLSEESFLKNSNVLSNLKLRLGYGVTGQQYITSNNYPYLAQYSYSLSTARYLFGNEWVTMARPAGYNANLKWEETTTTNVGLDYGFLKDRINGSVELYYRETKDLINEIPVAMGTNFTNKILTNIGTLENKGIEFNLNVKPIVSKDLTWEIGFNFTRNINNITKLTAVDDPSYKGVEVGTISTGKGLYAKINSVGHPVNTYYVYQQVYDPQGKPIEGLYVDRNKDGKITIDDRYYNHSSAPDCLLGISSRLDYKNWEFSFSGRASIGNYIYADYEAGGATYQYLLYGTFIQNVPTSVLNSGFNTQQVQSDYYVRNASFFRMDNMSLAYRFDGLWNNKVNMKLSLTAQNVFVITKYDGLDPEVFDGMDNTIYPRPTTILFGVNLDF
jgi:TonB-dependent starch-binding outer membrane protein SusC